MKCHGKPADSGWMSAGPSNITSRSTIKHGQLRKGELLAKSLYTLR